ncbi:multidrug effflux MFS transporter [Roseomonas sp. BN140053]|uniref:multidrug effflux MFS transporter n=1 Tax=Roseomonas sp. BN140053 TaxID=3391898 RepID=UPI0039E7D82F
MSRRSVTPDAAPALPPGATGTDRHGMGFATFVALIAAMMAVNALAIDSMLPALPAIGASLGIATDNGRQWVITAYLLGFGAAQLFYGLLADRYGRRPVLLAGLLIYVLASAGAAFSASFEVMMVARLLQGVGAAGTRVLSVAIVRDCYAGRQMARVMSLSFIVFLAVPVLAPSIGQLILLVAPWRWIFGVLMLFGAAVMLWAALRLPETLHPQDRRPIALRPVWNAVARTLSQRISLGYTAALTLIMGGLFGFINSAQQIFADVFHAPALFPAVFAGIAVFMAIASLLNSRIVGRLGMRRVSHGAMLGYVIFGMLHTAVALAGFENIWTFAALQAATMFFFGLMGPNFGTMAMEPLGDIAGTASAVQGSVNMVIGAVLGFAIGHQFAGTTLPMTLGFSGYGLLTLLVVLWTERGRLMHPSPNPG